MKRLLLISAVAAALAAGLGGCATTGYAYDDAGFNAYYDDFYGPYYDGYWGRDGFFWYRPGAGRPHMRDENHHFQRGHGQGFHGVHASRSPFHRH